jgi:hypothetical protein
MRVGKLGRMFRGMSRRMWELDAWMSGDPRRVGRYYVNRWIGRNLASRLFLKGRPRRRRRR